MVSAQNAVGGGEGCDDDDDLGFRAPQQGSYMAPMEGKGLEDRSLQA